QGTGFSSFVSSGNNTDISATDLVQYWEADPETNLVMLYLETFGDPREFSRVARRASRTMPILAVKGGRSAAGARAATTSHSGVVVRPIIGLAGSRDVDALVVIYTPQVGSSAQEAARGVLEAAASLPKAIPIVAVFMSVPDAPSLLRSGAVRIPTYPFPEDAARALGHAHRYASWRQSPSEPAPPLEGVDAHRAAAVLSATLAQGPGWLPPAAVTALLACYGLAPAESVLVATPHDAGDAAKKLGGKVALKGLVAGLIRKSDAGAVRLDLEGSHEVEAAAKDIAQRMAAIGQKVQAFMVQRMAPAGVEMLVGVVQDRHFGPASPPSLSFIESTASTMRSRR